MLRIKEIRKNKKITAKEIADYVNVAESTMSLYENGKREPDYSTLLKIAEFLDVSVDYLLGKTDQKEKPTAISDGEPVEEDVVIFHRDGKTQKKKLSKDQLAMLIAMVDALPESDDED